MGGSKNRERPMMVRSQGRLFPIYAQALTANFLSENTIEA